jgi:GxxExxY protein
MPLEFDGTQIDVGYRLDMRIDSVIIVENKTVEKLLPVHQAQVLTYLKLSGSSLGFLINWNVPVLREGLKRIVLNHPSRPIKANREDAKDGKK